MPVRTFVIDGEAETAAVADYERTRRELVRRGIVTAGALVAAGSIPLLLGARDAFAQAEGDVGILEAAIDLEQKAVFAYNAAAGSTAVDGRTTRLAALFRAHEQQHADLLIRALEKRLGGKAPPRPRVPSAVPGLEEAARGGQAAIVRFALRLEEMLVAGYHDALGRLEDHRLLQTAASIMGNEGQHLVVLRQAARLPPVPSAFETGEGGVA